MISPTVGFWELRVTSATEAERFYCGVFGLSAAPFHGYTMLSTVNGRPVAGLEQVDEAPPTDGFFRPTFDSSDLEADLEAIEVAGGRTLVARQVLPDGYGWWAAAEDPFGNRLQLSTDRPPVTTV